VKARLTALQAKRSFEGARDQSLFHATLANGDNFQINRTTARRLATEALNRVGFPPDGRGALALSPSFTAEEIADITSGCYALLLMLAETEARRLPLQADKDHDEGLQRALALLDRAELLGVQSRAIHLRRARYYAETGKDADAARESHFAKALTPETDLDAQDHFLVGHEFYIQGELELANAEFRRALQLNANDFWTNYFLGICCITSGKSEVAVAYLTNCQRQKPDLTWIYLLRGFALGQLEDYSAAEADFDQALLAGQLQADDPTLYVLLNNRGVMRVGRSGKSRPLVGAHAAGVLGCPLGHGPLLAVSALYTEIPWTKGVEDLKRAVALPTGHDQYQAKASLAEAYRLDGQLEEASKYQDEAIATAARQVQSGDVRPATLALLHYGRARLHLSSSQRDEAVRSLVEAARLAKDDLPLLARAEADRGRVLHLQEKFDDALAAYQAALKADPTRVEVFRFEGEMFLAKSDYRAAATAFDAFLEKGGPPTTAVYRERGLARMKLSLHTEAVDDFGRALDGKPTQDNRAALYVNRGREYLILKLLDAAMRDFEDALRLDPHCADAYLGRALVQIKRENAEEAVADADMAVQSAAKNPHLWLGAARIYSQAAAQLKPAQDRTGAQAKTRTQYQERAVVLLRTALGDLPPEEQRSYWREQVTNDAALDPIRGNPGFLELADRYSAKEQ
jgi:eukaryotic-like serine/threonine-protein kinase